jgi:uncharacterized membrane protein
MSSTRFVSPSTLTRSAIAVSAGIVAASALFLARRYTDLPDILPVHFNRYGLPDGWQYKTYARVLMPVLVQAALVLTFGSVGLLLLSRPHGDHDRSAPDVMAAAAAAEAIALIALVWVAFQAYAAFALAGMWQRQRGGLGAVYVGLEITGFVATVIIFARANARFGRPAPRPFNPEHWRLGQLYNNPADPALFVPTRDGSRWTLNFGRPVAAALMGAVLFGGIVGPAVILRLLLR